MPSVREYESALERNPADTEAFVALRKAYRQGKQHDRLITLYETRAQAIEDGPKAAELFYLSSELRLDQLGDTAGAEADLANAVHRDPSHIRAAARLKDLYREQGRTADYMEMLEMEAAAVSRTRDPARLAELQSEMSQLFVNHFAALERTIRTAQRPGKLSTDDVKSIESARKIYRAFGDYRSVVRLYDLELEGTSDPKRRADLLLGLGRILAEKLEELDAAAQRLTEVIRLRPRDEKALELLASVYANPNWIGADGGERAANIYFQVARRRQEAGDTENAIAALRKALAAVPGHPEAADLLERTYYEARRLQDLDRYYRERIQAATTDEEQINFLYKRAQLAEGDLGDTAEAQRIYGEIASSEPPGGPAGERLAELYLAGHEYAKLAELREKQLGGITESAARVRLMTELASLYAERLGDRDQAAVYLHAILQAEPTNRQALDAYADHFRDKGDWPALADLLDFGFEQARAAHAPVEALLRRLDEIAVVAEKNLGDPERALAAWERMEELDPVQQRARDMQKRILLKSKNFERIVPVLEREAALVADPEQKIEILRRVAQIHREKLGAPSRALEIYADILQLAPKDQVALRAMVEIYERSENFEGLAATMRIQVEAALTKQERVSLLRRLLAIYDEHLNDVDSAAWAANEILKLVPGDRDTLTRLEDVLLRAEDYSGLVQTLDYHAQHTTTSDERIQILTQAAEVLSTHLSDAAGAAERWEEIVRADPDDGRALDALTEIYATLERHNDLARILDAQVDRLVGDPQKQAEYLQRLADVVEAKLGDKRRAQRAWEARLEILPADSTTLDALARIYGETEDWGTLVRILDRQIPHVRDPAAAVVLALRRAEILDVKLEKPLDAVRTLEQLIAELDPRSWEAHERLRELYEREGNWARVVKIAERQLSLTEVPDERLRRALEIGSLWRDQLKDGGKAIAAFERAREIAPRSSAAMDALRALYEEGQDWKNLVEIDERILELTDDQDERQVIIEAIATTYETRLGDPARAFGWYRRLHAELPTDVSLARLEHVAETHKLFEELIEVYANAQRQASERPAQLSIALKIAAICEEKLVDPARAFSVLRENLSADPPGRELLPHLERLGELTKDWTGLLEVYARVAGNRPELNERVRLLHLRAEVRERRMGDASGALDELMRSFVMDPQDSDTQHEILRLANVTGRWEDALKVQAQLFALAEDLPSKLAVARHAAALVETEVKDLIRAFRAYLNAFRLAPEDEDLVRHLWRLAGLIGRYTPLPAVTTRGEHALAALEPEEVPRTAKTLGVSGVPALTEQAANARENSEGASPGSPGGEEHDTPVELGADAATSIEDETSSSESASPFVEDTDDAEDDGTVDVDDAAVLSVAVDTESSGALEEIDFDDLDISDAEESTPRPPPSRGLPAPINSATGAPPPLPAPGRRTPFGAAFDTPWEELAQAYEALPAGDAAIRLRYLLKQAEVWEKGQKDIAKALAVLDRAFRLAPEDRVVRADLERIAGDQNRWDQVCDIFLGGIDEFAPAEHAISVHLEVARFREALGQIDKAEERFQAILKLRPDEPRALERLEQITRSQERWPELAAILERRTSGNEALPAGAERRAKLGELAGLYERALEKPYEAIDSLEKLVEESEEETAEAAIGDTSGASARAESDDDNGEDEPTSADSPAAKKASDPATLDASRIEIISACEALTRLYGRVGMWAKVVETLQREADLTVDPAGARAVRIRVADIYERELGHAERAMEAFEAIRAADPNDAEALAALDRLYESHSRWDDLQEILAQRASLASESERLDFVRRRARVLEDRLGNPDAAASALRDLGTAGLADRDLTSALVRNLRRAGLSHEAARILTQLIDSSRDSEATKASVIPLLLELSAVRADDLDDAAGARQAVTDALTIAPEDPNTLGALARIALKENDFVTYAATRRREARARMTSDEAVAALLDAGRVYREQANSPAEARACFEEALAREPGSVEALRALAALHAAEGEWTEARERLLRQLELVDGPEAQAAVLTDLARAVWEGSSDVTAAQRYLDEALELAPDHLPAVLAAADIYYKEGQWAAAERRLTEAIRRLRSSPDQAARLYTRLAEVSERLGRLDESFRQLSESDRLAPGQLATRLAIGENRFRAGKWREAISYLTPLADHPEAARQASGVADGLAHAAQAEMKLRRPERCLALYESALALRPNHAPSLRALADLALERGDKPAARAYLEKLVEGEGDREVRVGVLEQLGDLYLEANEPSRARATYESAPRLFERPTEILVNVLEKALRMQREANDFEAATHSVNLLIELVQDPKERAQRRREAAMMIAARGEGDEALELLEAAFADNAEDDSILSSLCDLLARQGKHKQVAKRLAEVLPQLPAPADNPAARTLRAGLWERFGEARRKKDPVEAIGAFERAVELDANRMGARIALATLYGPRAEFADAALLNLRRLAEADPGRPDSIRALGDAFADRGMLDPARCAYELLETIDALDDNSRAFLKAHPAPEMNPDDPYAANLDETDRASLAGREASVMSEVFNLLWEGAPHLLNERLEDLGVTAEDKISPMSDLEVAKVYGQIAKALGNRRTVLYIKKDAELAAAEIVVQTPPALVFGSNLLSLPTAQVRFEIARGLELTRPEYILAAGVKPKQFTELFGTVLRAFHPRHAKRRTNAQDTASEQAAALRKNVPYKVSKRLVEIFQEVGSTSWSSVKWRKVVAETGNRAGLLTAGDLRAAMPAFLRTNKISPPSGSVKMAELIREHEVLRDWLRFALSDEYFRMREKLGTAAIRAVAA